MPLDAAFLHGLTAELNETLAGARIDKITMPGREEIVLSGRGAEGNFRLLLSASRTTPRLGLLRENRENPPAPPMFCMLLRKHLQNGRITQLRQLGFERAVRLTVESRNELGDPTQYALILEIIGVQSNLIFLDGQGRIVDALKRSEFSESLRRTVMPGARYELPPAQNKRDPLTQLDEILSALRGCREKKPADRVVLDAAIGFSPLISREIVCRALGSCDMLYSELHEAQRQRVAQEFARTVDAVLSGDTTPVILYDEDQRPVDFSFLLLTQYGQLYRQVQPGSYCDTLEDFYGARERNERLRQRTSALDKMLRSAVTRTAKKLQKQRADLAACTDRDTYRIYGELLTAALASVERGAPHALVPNYYEEGSPLVKIPLDVTKSPAQNAQRYFKQYQKAKTAETMLTAQIEKGERELEYLESVLVSLSSVESERDIAEIRRELTTAGYLRPEKGAAKRRQREPEISKPMEFRSTSGFRILIGRNNSQNDYLTLTLASKQDIWLHAQGLPGSHVIVVTGGETPDDETLEQAAVLAATYSKSQQSQNVPVSYTEVRNVKKPAGSRPGKVIFVHYKTAYVTPSPELAQRLRVDGNGVS
ncbi:Rqc2 family fibronectin-binding protein [Feifania hominis]|uniref:Rqc2 homolog RqcH n=1 Tax=Feifania hominis TaxID=2763660 RepID=A0A926DCE6_9FIRM|nr:NFACT RNA binding domain-containing protein [Feifania hominis]MBC8535636.1 NFACT family protein [Feifania hominis]